MIASLIFWWNSMQYFQISWRTGTRIASLQVSMKFWSWVHGDKYTHDTTAHIQSASEMLAMVSLLGNVSVCACALSAGCADMPQSARVKTYGGHLLYLRTLLSMEVKVACLYTSSQLIGPAMASWDCRSFQWTSDFPSPEPMESCGGGIQASACGMTHIARLTLWFA